MYFLNLFNNLQILNKHELLIKLLSLNTRKSKSISNVGASLRKLILVNF